VGSSLKSEYREALDYLYSFIDYERKTGWKYDDKSFNLDRISTFLDILGSPHRCGRFVHIAGTNGKGSVAAMIAKSLSLAGLKTGLYTSPHLLSFRERIRIDGHSIPHAKVIDGVKRLKEKSGAVPGLTFFEIWTALAFDYFAAEKTDIAVIETGLGGRLDATSVITPELSVLTRISMDHCGILGNNLSEIAREKAGIIKQGVRIISAAQDDEALASIKEVATSMDSELLISGRDFTSSSSNAGFDYDGQAWHIKELSLSLDGSVQRENATVAIAALESLSTLGLQLTQDDAAKGLAEVNWPGRLHVIGDKPEVIVDGACNPGAMEKLIEFAESRTITGSKTAVVAMCGDKEIEAVLKLLATYVSQIIFTEVENPRAVPADKLPEYLPDFTNVTVCSGSGEAIKMAQSLSGSDGQVLVTGSLYLVGEAFTHFGIKNLDSI